MDRRRFVGAAASLIGAVPRIGEETLTRRIVISLSAQSTLAT